MKELERQLKAVANRRRLIILQMLKQRGKCSVSEIAEELRLSFRATSRHLAVLAAADIVEREQQSLFVWYRLNAAPHRSIIYILSMLS